MSNTALRSPGRIRFPCPTWKDLTSSTCCLSRLPWKPSTLQLQTTDPLCFQKHQSSSTGGSSWHRVRRPGSHQPVTQQPFYPAIPHNPNPEVQTQFYQGMNKSMQKLIQLTGSLKPAGVKHHFLTPDKTPSLLDIWKFLGNALDQNQKRRGI